MCRTCYEDWGEPRIDTPAVRAARDAAKAVYDFSCVGGNLHIVLDDFNVGDGHLEFCREQIEAGGYHSCECRPGQRDHECIDCCSPEQLAAELTCYRLFKVLSEDERLSALGFDNYWTPS